MKSIAVYTKHFENFIYNEASLKVISSKNSIFKEIDEQYEGRYLRFFKDNGEEGILLSDCPIRENPALSKYLYSGNDFAKNYLIDNGYFVPKDEFSTKESIDRHHDSIFYQYFNNYYRLVYNDNSYHNLSFNGLKHLYDKISQLEDVPQRIVNYLKEKIEMNNSFFGFDSKPQDKKSVSYSNLFISQKDSAYINSKISKFSEERSKKTNTNHYFNKFLLYFFIFILVISAFKYQRDYVYYYGYDGIFMYIFRNILVFIQTFFFVIVPLTVILSLIYVAITKVSSYFMKKNSSKHDEIIFKDREKYKQTIIDPLNEKIKEIIKEAIDISFEDMYAEEREIINAINEGKDLSGLLRTNSNDEKYVEINLTDLNLVYNFMMYCSYPYTMDNGEVFNSVFVNSKYDFYSAVRGNLNLMSNYFDYMETYVYPMVRQYGRNGISVAQLNNYVINEIRLQKRHEETLNKLMTLNNSIREMKRTADGIYSAIIEQHKEKMSKLDEINESIKNISVDVYVTNNVSPHYSRW